MKLKNLVFKFKTKNPEGFVSSEQKELLENFPQINKEKYFDALNGITCMMINDEMVIYHDDIFTALLCGLENRDMYYYEVD
jgi:hypothetical protein